MKFNFKRALSAITALLILQTSAFAAEISFDRDTRTITLSGQAKTSDNISVLILRPDFVLSADMTAEQIKNSILLPYEVTPDESGNYKVALIPPGDVDGLCKVILTSETEKINDLTVNVFSSTNLTNTLTDLSSAAAKGADEVSTLLVNEDVRKILGVDEIYSRAEYREELYNLIASKNSYSSYSDLKSVLNTIEEKIVLLNQFNEIINKAQVTELIEKLYAREYNKDEYYQKYIQMKNTETINQTIYSQKPYSSLNDVYNKFVQAVKNSKTTSQGSSGSSGGGGGGGVSAGMTGKYNSSSETVKTPQTAAKEKFNDVSGSHWAFKYVNELSEAGIVSGVSENSFEPDRKILREEFVKMIVNSLNKQGGIDNFTDSDKNSWYSPYLATASEIGLVEGKEDGSFGIGEVLTRQDMSVLIMRAIQISGIEIDIVSESDFIDETAISDYAKTSVASLSKAGIINGMGNNCFEPKESATRAQAAKMIYELRVMMEGVR